VLKDVQIQHEVEDGPLQHGAQPLVYGKSGAGDLGPPLEIQDAQGFADIPVRLGRKGKDRPFPPGPDHRVVLRRGAVLHRFVGDVGDDHDQAVEILLHLLQFLVQGLDTGGNLPHAGNQFRGVLLLLLFLPDLLGDGITVVAKFFHLLKDVPAARVQIEKRGHVHFLSPLQHLPSYQFRILADEFDVQHGLIPLVFFR